MNDLKNSIRNFLVALQEAGIPILENDEIANIIYEDLTEIVENAKLVGVMEDGAATAAFSGLGIIAGLISSGRATEANIRIVDNLIKAKKNCQDKNCEERVDAQIRKYKTKIGDKNWSMIRRAIGGGLVGPIGSLVYHFIDKRNKIRGINATTSAVVNKALQKCKDLPKTQKEKCEEQIRAKYSKFMGSMNGDRVYRKM